MRVRVLQLLDCGDWVRSSLGRLKAASTLTLILPRIEHWDINAHNNKWKTICRVRVRVSTNIKIDNLILQSRIDYRQTGKHTIEYIPIIFSVINNIDINQLVNQLHEAIYMRYKIKYRLSLNFNLFSPPWYVCTTSQRITHCIACWAILVSKWHLYTRINATKMTYYDRLYFKTHQVPF